MTISSRFDRAERLSDAVLHLMGLGLALAAVPVLVWASVARRGDVASVVAVSIYGVSLLAMLACSAAYNMTRASPRSAIFKRMDHSAIFVKIAGSYTPLVALTGTSGAPLLTALWITALGGSSLKIAAPDRLRWVGLSLYLGMGWIGIAFGHEILTAMTPGARTLVIVAGCLYTLGLPFFLWTSLPFHRPIWHGFVFVASGVLYAAVYLEICRVVDEVPFSMG